MKIRTDFVTNSSSSSFIFKEFDLEKVKWAVEQRLLIPPQDEWEEEDYAYVKDAAPYIVGKRFCEYEISDLFRVYEWYQEEIISSIARVDKRKYWVDRESWRQEIKRVFAENAYEGDTEKRLAAMLILDVCTEYLHVTDLLKSHEKKTEISMAFIKMQIWEYMGSWAIEYNELQDYYLNNIERLLVAAEEFDGKQFADVLEFLFEAQYLYFDDFETHYIICEALEKAGLCLYACGHMG